MLDTPHLLAELRSNLRELLTHDLTNPDQDRMEANAEKLREGLRAAGHGEFVPEA